jgi:hypothetical protein
MREMSGLAAARYPATARSHACAATDPPSQTGQTTREENLAQETRAVAAAADTGRWRSAAAAADSAIASSTSGGRVGQVCHAVSESDAVSVGGGEAGPGVRRQLRRKHQSQT